MQSAWLSRLFFAVVAAMAIGAVISGAACTRYGQPGPVVPTTTPLSTITVDAVNGNDTTGTGGPNKPYKTLTKAVSVLTNSKLLSPNGVTISLASGDYNAANGEKFPIVVPRTVTINGSNYSAGLRGGSFVDGLGQDTIFEELVHAPPRSEYATLEVVPPATVSLNTLYLGASKISLPAHATYAAFDVIGTASGTNVTLGAGILSGLRNIDGVLVASGTFTCTSCVIHGNDFGIAALTVPLPSASPAVTVPSITLAHSTGVGDSSISARVADLVTDGSANINVSEEAFLRSQYAFADALSPIVTVPIRGTTDFGGGGASSPGGNRFIGARISEFWITKTSETVSALDDTWNPSQQGANRNGVYPRMRTFGSGASGKNVRVAHDASGSTVMVGPAPVPTPSTTPTGPTPTPT